MGLSKKNAGLAPKLSFEKKTILKIIVILNIYLKLIPVSRRGLYLDHYFS